MAKTENTFKAMSGTSDQYSKPNSAVGQCLGKSMDVKKVSKSNGGLDNKRGPNSDKTQFSN